jgi:hypothetical protein
MHGEDRPDDRIIADDNALDSWYEKYSLQKQRQSAGKMSTVAYADAINSLPSYKPA